MSDETLICEAHWWVGDWYASPEEAGAALRERFEGDLKQDGRLPIFRYETQRSLLALSQWTSSLESMYREDYERIQTSGLYVEAPDGDPRHVLHEEEEDFAFESVGLKELQGVLSMNLGDHNSALELLAKYGHDDNTVRVSWDRTLPQSSAIRCIWPSHFWGEVIAIQRASWLHNHLLADPGALDEFLGPKYLVNEKSGETSYIKIHWPEHLTLSWCDPYLIHGAIEDNPTLFFWDYFTGLINEGQKRNSGLGRLYFDRVNRTVSDRRSSVGNFWGAMWELLERRALAEIPPIACQICGRPVKARRSTRMYCDRAGCRKAAQRAKQKVRSNG